MANPVIYCHRSKNCLYCQSSLTSIILSHNGAVPLYDRRREYPVPGSAGPSPFLVLLGQRPPDQAGDCVAAEKIPTTPVRGGPPWAARPAGCWTRSGTGPRGEGGEGRNIVAGSSRCAAGGRQLGLPPMTNLGPGHPADTVGTNTAQHSTRACGRCAPRFRLGPPPAYAGALAPRCLRVPDLTPTPWGPEGEVRNTTALLHE